MSDFGNEPIWVAVDQDWKPLDADDGPVELVIPGDAKPARWVHGVASIDVEKIATAV